jgi:predicted aspartyl protease
MILGNVNTNREAIIQLAVLGENKQKQGIRAIIDTGYTGCLTLPSAVITTLGLTWYMQQEGILGDGSLCMFNVYEASLIWDGQIREVLPLRPHSTPHGHTLSLLFQRWSRPLSYNESGLLEQCCNGSSQCQSAICK